MCSFQKQQYNCYGQCPYSHLIYITTIYVESFVQKDNNGVGIGNSPFPDIMMHVLLDEIEVISPLPIE